MGRSAKRFGRKLYCLTEKINDTLDIPQCAIPGTAQIEMAGNREVIVDGCRGILQYEDSVIRISTGRLVIRFTGTDLVIRTIEQNQIQICGTILSVDFS